MALKRDREVLNDLLGHDDSDNDIAQHEADELHKGTINKRRKLNDGENYSDKSESDDVEDANDLGDSKQTEPRPEMDNSHNLLGSSEKPAGMGRAEPANEEIAGALDHVQENVDKLAAKKSKSKLQRETERATNSAKKTGVVYLSRVPPFMKPQKLRSLLEPYGKVDRIYLTPEDPQARKMRRRHGGNNRLSYTEGWVEFVRKSDAKKVADMLNAQPIGGRKGSFYHDDIWNIMYLKGFKWHHLTEQMERENKEREGRLRAEIEKSKRENEAFVKSVDIAKMLEKRKKRKGDEQVQSSIEVPKDVVPRQVFQKRPLGDASKKIISQIL